MRLSVRIYKALLRLYPAGFREEYGAPLEREFEDEYADAVARRGVAAFWVRTLADLAVSVPAQMAREIGQDTRHALRLWRRRPIHTAFAAGALAVGLGANVGVFSVVNALLLRSLPFHEPHRVAAMWAWGFSPTGIGSAPKEFHDWRANSAYLEDAARFNTAEVNLTGPHLASRARLTETSANFFSMLGSRPPLGRSFADGEDTPGRNGVAIISYALWQQMYGGDPGALGEKLAVNGTPLTIIGVARPGFDYPRKTSVWSPTTFEFAKVPKTQVTFTEHIGRIRTGVSWEQARQAFEAEAYRRNPQARKAGAENRPAFRAIGADLAGAAREASLALMGGVALILLIACANVANLLLARTSERAGELTIRTALGASRARLSQQMLTESLLLSAAAAAGGMLAAWWTVSIASAAQPAQLASQAYTLLDWRVLGFAVSLAAITGVVFGVAPALHAGRLGGAMQPGRYTASRPSMGRLREALVAVQAALTVVLLASSFVLGRAFLDLLGVDNGFETRNIATVTVSLAGTRYEASETMARAYYRDALDRIRTVPGVVEASGADYLPLNASSFMGGMFQVDREGPQVLSIQVPVAPGYFSAMGGRVLHGREFEESDRSAAERSAIVGESFARRFGDPASAVGRAVTAGKRSLRIVGVVRDLRFSGPLEESPPQIYTLSDAPNYHTFVVKVRGPAADRIGEIRRAAQSVDAAVPVFDVKTMSVRLDEALARPKFYTTAVVFFGGFALLLAVMGICGVVTYSVAQRSREMGVRLALGTTPAMLRGWLLRRGMTTVAAGAAAGVAGAFATGQALESMIRGARQVDIWVCVAAVALLAALVAAGIWSATRRIGRLDIVEVLRTG